jgi:hypothetical protein
MERETTYHRKCCGLYCAKSWNVRLDQLAGKVFLGALSVFIMWWESLKFPLHCVHFECLPRPMCWSLGPQRGASGKCCGPLGGRALWEVLRSLGIMGLWDSSLLYFLADEVSILFCHILLPWCTTLAEAQNNGTNRPWSGTFTTVSQNKTFLFVSWLPQVFHYSDGKLTNTLCFLEISTNWVFVVGWLLEMRILLYSSEEK